MKDHTERAANWLRVIGVLSLLTLNLGGLIWIWLARHIRRKSHGHRIGAIAILAIQVVGLTWFTATGVLGVGGTNVTFAVLGLVQLPLFSIPLF